jgi:hypothetical protein
MKNLIFTHHANDRLTERGVSKSEVYDTLKHPDTTRPSEKGLGRLIAERRLKTGHTLRVIYTEDSEFYIVISVIKIGRKRRGGR